MQTLANQTARINQLRPDGQLLNSGVDPLGTSDQNGNSGSGHRNPKSDFEPIASDNQGANSRPDHDNSLNSGSTITTPRLRPDAERLVDRLILQAYGKTRREKLTAYADAKRAISRCCGWDAPPMARDDEMYNRAIGRFVRGVGL